MKKLLALILTGALTMGALSACGSTGPWCRKGDSRTGGAN